MWWMFSLSNLDVGRAFFTAFLLQKRYSFTVTVLRSELYASLKCNVDMSALFSDISVKLYLTRSHCGFHVIAYFIHCFHFPCDKDNHRASTLVTKVQFFYWFIGKSESWLWVEMNYNPRRPFTYHALNYYLTTR